LFRQLAEFRILAVLELDLRHVDRALVMRDHHGDDVAIRIACHRRGHVSVHLRHAVGAGPACCPILTAFEH
jgi:hypothetical protein